MDIKSQKNDIGGDRNIGETITVVPDPGDTFIGYTTGVVEFLNSAPWENIVSVLGNEDVVIHIHAFKSGTPLKAEEPASTGEGVPAEVPVEESSVQDTPEPVKGDIAVANRSVEATLLESALNGQTFQRYEQAVAFYSAVKRALEIVGAVPGKFTLVMADDNGAYTVKLAAATAPLSDFIRRLSGLFPW